MRQLWQDGEPWQRRWMAKLGQVMYLVERYKKINAAAAKANAQVRVLSGRCIRVPVTPTKETRCCIKAVGACMRVC